MATLTVGTDKQFQTVSAAVAASQDGDTILVDAGTYTNDFAHITTDITSDRGRRHGESGSDRSRHQTARRS